MKEKRYNGTTCYVTTPYRYQTLTEPEETMKNYVKAEKRVKKYCKVVPEYL